MKSLPNISAYHHVTATTFQAQEDYQFYTHLLGLRLVKRTVNFDDPTVYHFYYAPTNGMPGTVFTTFPYADKGIRKGTPGYGQVYATAFSITEGALPFWRNRFSMEGLKVEELDVFGRPGLAIDDPSGLRLEFHAYGNDLRASVPRSGIGEPFAIRGLAAVVLRVPEMGQTLDFLQKELGFHHSVSAGERALVKIGEGGSGRDLILWEDPNAEKGKGGTGTVHHVAFQIPSEEELVSLRKRVAEDLGFKVTEIKDRKYFKSIYFRIPGGVLFEIATVAPGFAIDESEDLLGEKLMLPEWAENDRTDIEKILPEISAS